MEYWSAGVLGWRALYPITPILHHCIIPIFYTPLSDLHGLGSSGFTATSNTAGPL
jgi:hypothetical protein